MISSSYSSSITRVAPVYRSNHAHNRQKPYPDPHRGEEQKSQKSFGETLRQAKKKLQ